MRLSILDLRRYNKPGPIPPHWLTPESYINVSHLDTHGRWPITTLIRFGDLKGASNREVTVKTFSDALDKIRNAR